MRALLFSHKALLSALIGLCVLRGMAVLLLNNGYANLINSIFSGAYGQFWKVSLLLLCSGIAQVAIIYSQDFVSSVLSEKVGYSIRSQAVNSSLYADFAVVKQQNAGDSLTRLNTDLDSITEWLHKSLSSLLTDSILFIMVLTALIVLNRKLTVFSFALVLLLPLLSYRLSKPISKASKESRAAATKVNAIIKSIADNFTVFKFYNMENSMRKKLGDLIGISVDKDIRSNKIIANLMSVNGFISYMPIALMWGAGGYMVIRGEFTAGALLAFVNLSNFVRGPLVNLPDRISSIRMALVNVHRVDEMLNKLKMPANKGGRPMSACESAAVSFNDVSFRYDENKSCIEHISFEVQKNSKIAIVGESGCGKSTLLKLIAGLYPIDRGEIDVYGSNVSQSDPAALRNCMAYVPQEPQLFPVSIFENITCGHPIPTETVLAACQAAQLDTVVEKLPQGIHSSVGECGGNLSGGERQRISIARALAKDAPLVLLDEATSALDQKTESAIMEYFDSLRNHHTLIMVTHKLKNAANADRIYCMQDGRICESGSHDQLMHSGGYYARLYTLQNMPEVHADEAYKSTVS